MAPPPPAAPAPQALPRSETAVKNLASLCACCRDPMDEADPVAHPHRPFMVRAIELSRIGGIEKRTGGCFGAVVVRNGVVSFFLLVAVRRALGVGADPPPPSPAPRAKRKCLAPSPPCRCVDGRRPACREGFGLSSGRWV